MTDNIRKKEFWDGMAKPCSYYERRSFYANEFLKKSQLLQGDTVLDFGCGSGTLCLPLHDDGYSVVCADFSERMLDSVREVIKNEGINNISIYSLSWEDDWEKAGLPICDVAFASRCLFDVNPIMAFRKLSAHAKRRVCVTLPTSAGMFRQKASPYELGTEEEMQRYVMSCLDAVRQLGYFPQADSISAKEGQKAGWLFLSWNTAEQE